ncbi:MAG TPA: hypothetical protein PKD92_08910 [Novosphingobium sp.]|nr:hypothetical protein [Novosphingobium sp.]HMP56676.1 hypothetical protein [Novosphingobium sp.]
MRRFKMLVLSEPYPGHEDEFNRWYSERHLADVCAQPAYVAAARFELHSVVMGQPQNRWLAIYDMETDDPDKAVADLFALRGTPAMPIPDCFNFDTAQVFVYEDIPGAQFSRAG